MNNTKRKTARILMASLLCALMLVSACPVQAFAVSQEQINAVQAQRDALTQKREAAQSVVDELENEQADVMERKAAMDERNQYTIQQIKLNEEEIKLYDELIADKREEAEEAKRLEEEQLERYRARVRSMEENGSYGYLGIVLQAENLSDLLTAIDDMGEIMESDKELEHTYLAAREHAEEVKAEYEAYKAELEAKQDALRAEQEQLEAELEEATNLIKKLQEDIDANADILNEIMAAEEAADAELQDLIAKREEERKQQEAAAGGGGGGGGSGVVGTGSYIWPTPSCYYITSRCGDRWHPITGKWRFHSGVDIGAAYGATVLAADGGEVICAGKKGGYGNAVMIDHGNGDYTLYGHLSSIAVSNGQTVSQGDTIGYVGSTGNSTGPHLHFEIQRGRGNYLDPEQFFSGGFTYASDAGD